MYTKVTYVTFFFRLLHYHLPHLDIVPWTLNATFSAIQEVIRFCTTGFCSCLVRLLAENRVYATFQVRSVNQLDREHCSYSRTLTKLISCTSEKKKLLFPCFVYIWQNWQHHTDYWLEDNLFYISLFLGWWISFHLFPVQNFPWKKY